MNDEESERIKKNITQALKEVDLIQRGELPRRPAREMLERARRKLDDEE